MANNRMLLIHRPTGLAIMLGKHMGWGWYKPPSGALLRAFYDRIESECHSMVEMEDFCIGMESCDAKTPYVKTDWDGYYPDDGNPKFIQTRKPL